MDLKLDTHHTPNRRMRDHITAARTLWCRVLCSLVFISALRAQAASSKGRFLVSECIQLLVNSFVLVTYLYLLTVRRSIKLGCCVGRYIVRPSARPSDRSPTDTRREKGTVRARVCVCVCVGGGHFPVSQHSTLTKMLYRNCRFQSEFACPS